MEARSTLPVVSPFKNPRNAATFGGIMLRYAFTDGTELHLYLHELFRPEINKLLQAAIRIHGEASITEPRAGRFV